MIYINRSSEAYARATIPTTVVAATMNKEVCDNAAPEVKLKLDAAMPPFSTVAAEQALENIDDVLLPAASHAALNPSFSDCVGTG